MPRGKPIGTAKRSAIITLHREGYSVRQICNKVKVARSTVHDTITRYQTTGDLADRARSGRPRITTKADDQRLKLISKRNRRLTAPEIASDFNRGCAETVSVSTVKRRLQEANLHGRVAVRKPLLRRGNRLKRLQWARTHADWAAEQWRQVLWTDESKFKVFGQKRRTFVRRSKDEKMLRACILPTVKHAGGSIQVWGCFSYAGTGELKG